MTATAQQLFSKTMAVCRGAFLYVALFSCAINILMLTAPIYMMQVFDRILSSRSVESLVTLLTIAIFALLIMSALEAVRSMMLIRVGAWMDDRLSTAVFAGQVTQAIAGEASAQPLRDLSTFRTFLTGGSIFPILDAPWTPIFLFALFVLHPAMGGLAMGGAALLFLIAVINEVATRGLLAKSGHLSEQALTAAEQAARNADVIQAMGMMGRLQERWRPINAESLRLQNLASDRGARLTATSKFIRMTLQVGIMSLGAYLVLLEQVTPGAMIAGSILMGRALAPVEQAIGTWKQAVAARQSYGRLRRHIAKTDLDQDRMALPAPEGKLSVTGVGYFHAGHDDPALNKVSFDLEPGQHLGVTGPTASGKTTLARVLVGNLKPTVGHVRLDGMDAAEWQAEDLGQFIGYLPQDVELFPGTIGENIARLGEVDPDKVVEAARFAGVHNDVLKLPGGYDYEIGEAGRGLSGGQKQRIGLARALYGDIRLVVLDEPNANLDSDGELALLSVLDNLKQKGVTTVIVAHRPSVMTRVDHMLVLKDGEVAALGPRDEVLAQLSGRPQGAPQPSLVRKG